MSSDLYSFHGPALLAVLAIAVNVAFIGVARGPSLGDRVVALDLAGMIGAAIGCVAALAYDALWPLDVALAIALVNFLATTALARYIAVGSPERKR